MSDIVKRLRVPVDSQEDWIIGTDKLMAEAADEIEHLQAALNGMQKAVSQLHEAIDAIERLGTALIEKK